MDRAKQLMLNKFMLSNTRSQLADTFMLNVVVRYTITNDTFMLDVSTGVWSRVPSSNQPRDSVPSARAAHASASVGQYQMVVYGGATGGGGLSNDDV